MQTKAWWLGIVFSFCSLQAQVLDTTFGTNGLVTTNVHPTLNIETLQTLLVLENGQLLVGGTNNTNGYLLRYNTDGSLDTTFHDNGVLLLPVRAVVDLVTDSNNTIYLLAQKDDVDSYYDFVIGKMDGEGNFDNSFGTNGLRVYNLGSLTDDIGYGFTLQPDGKIVVVGNTSLGSGSLSQIFVARILPNGNFDTTFSSDGRAFLEMINHRQLLNHVSILPDGRILGSGEVILTTGSNQTRICVVRFLPNGDLDTSFSDDGFTYFNIGTQGASGSDSHVLLPDNSVIIGGSTYSPDNSGVIRNFALVKLTESGDLDTSFGTDGKVVSLIPSFYAEIQKLVKYGEHLFGFGFSYQTGVGNDNFTLAKYELDGTLVTDFGQNGFLFTDFFGRADIGYTIAVDETTILLGGFATVSSSPTNRHFAMARYLDDNGLAVASNTIGNQVHVSPTHFSDSIQLYSSEPQEVEVYLFDLSGKLLHQKALPLTNEPSTLFLSGLTNGMYLLQLHLQDGERVQTVKIVKS
jgi:uncharacterized delta-60 repeat protein